ncbi:uncharacterized protein [Narcine bancroftii]|uniref:uncharacterized protein isoform X2 n=1 Tax=Narcine bancroftii TaxID=1343680 RepID=UPI00383165EB
MKLGTRRWTVLSLALASLALLSAVAAFGSSHWCVGSHRAVKPLCLSATRGGECLDPAGGQEQANVSEAGSVRYVWETGDDRYALRAFHTGFWVSCEEVSSLQVKCRSFLQVTPESEQAQISLPPLCALPLLSPLRSPSLPFLHCTPSPSLPLPLLLPVLHHSPSPSFYPILHPPSLRTRPSTPTSCSRSPVVCHRGGDPEHRTPGRRTCSPLHPEAALRPPSSCPEDQLHGCTLHRPLWYRGDAGTHHVHYGATYHSQSGP